ncbi:MAG: hypothetical protein E6J59_00370 [Deltaproteobacteria bacterium]|nr:MAG: hypothetical protein E6J59_00370 [Deltaproteobacteria bacterium]
MRWALLVLAALAACGRGADVIVVGSKNFTEQRILGELLAQTVESVGLRAERKLDLGGTFVCDAAIRAGQIDMYVEYTGTALAAILKGGLGVFIFRGVAMVDNRTILAGALPAAALAVGAELALGAVERRVRPPR